MHLPVKIQLTEFESTKIMTADNLLISVKCQVTWKISDPLKLRQNLSLIKKGVEKQVEQWGGRVPS